MLLYWLCDNQRLVEELIILIPKCQTFLQFLKLLLCLSVNYIWLNLGNCIFWGNYFELLNISLLVLSSDGSGSKNFDPRWVNFLWLWSGRVWSGLVGSAIYGLGLNLENFPRKCQIFQFFSLQVEKNLFGLGQKVPGSKAGQHLTAGQKYARVGSGPISSPQPVVIAMS